MKTPRLAKAGVAVLVATLVSMLAACSAASMETTATPAPDLTLAQTAQLASDGRQKLVECLNQLGWNVVLEDDGWSMEGLPQEQFEAYQKDEDSCKESSGLNDIPIQALTPDRLSEIYDFEIQLATCLRDEGFDIPQAPSEQVFAESYTGPDAWFAYKFVETTDVGGEEEWQRLEAACPQYGAG